jgi:regulator of RNase E activity RraA
MTLADHEDARLHSLERLAALDSCVLSDALDRLDLPGAVTGIGPLSAARRIAGRAVTVKLGPAGPGRSGRHLCTAAVESGGPGSVVVVEHPGAAAAGWGGILSLAAVVRGIEGVVVDGPARDIDEAVALGFPVFARSATPVTARGRIAEVGWDVPVTIGSCRVTPGDLVLADSSGVVFVPAGRAREVIGVAAALAARESEMALAVKRGDAVSEVMGSTYEQLLERAEGGR